MAKQTMIDTTLLAGNASEAIDLSGNANALAFTATIDEVDTTTISDLVKRRIGSVTDASFSCSVFDDDSGQPWDTLEDIFNTACQFGWVESNASMAEADFGVMLQALEASFEMGGAHGEARMVNISGAGDGPMIFGQVLQQDESLTTTGSSVGFQFGTVTTGETLVGNLWVLSVTAGTIDCVVESDSAGFAGANTRGTFAQASGTTSERIEMAGDASGDDYFRLTSTIATGPATVVCMIGKK